MTHYEHLRGIVLAWTEGESAATRSLERWCVIVATLLELVGNTRMVQAITSVGAEISARARREQRTFAEVCADVHRDLSMNEVATVDLLVEALAEAYRDAPETKGEELAP